ncbi:MerR family transcriptional regulator [Levilactobacillus brevis]|uniref:HTH-type transcriptional regulator AdhR family protein n=1 Tax=Levilactobacillus brevis ATCC 14869 = DSM 20054 TaxID=649758 RepID=U2NZJ8_LEVBR|nr:MerR family transcriptional regulator [Levilactobacillus brevis]ERK43575.1 HTH-type transcriptional regulator AdhR family protein [Levilactobacillus brevis ATCC 14869 = DSM 20054]KIO99130.1 Transcriptional regulator, MerR family [Levilactobacillus brevis]KRK20775.1 transcriptional regulator [Levilactobacillus brevis ATCC 14869 = DSM 20054]MCT3572934.1 MerR family transcriptional regulator [Levilactobacillus brevis]QCZ49253.1 mobile element protein [Levilactobacillus brevis]
MLYSIGQVADKLNISTYTLRYYDKEGLLPFVDRNESGRRIFKDADFNYLETISCLKEAGLPVKQIASFIELCLAGDRTLDERYEFLAEQETNLEEKMATLQHTMDFLRWKKWYYKRALAAGTEDVNYIPGTTETDPALRSKFEAMVRDGMDAKELGLLDK